MKKKSISGHLGAITRMIEEGNRTVSPGVVQIIAEYFYTMNPCFSELTFD